MAVEGSSDGEYDYLEAVAREGETSPSVEVISIEDEEEEEDGHQQQEEEEEEEE